MPPTPAASIGTVNMLRGCRPSGSTSTPALRKACGCRNACTRPAFPPNRCTPLVARGLHSRAYRLPFSSSIKSKAICPVNPAAFTSLRTHSRAGSCRIGSK
ncbi:hypothetical protein D3C75_986870 [compost metagenome]